MAYWSVTAKKSINNNNNSSSNNNNNNSNNNNNNNNNKNNTSNNNNSNNNNNNNNNKRFEKEQETIVLEEDDAERLVVDEVDAVEEIGVELLEEGAIEWTVLTVKNIPQRYHNKKCFRDAAKRFAQLKKMQEYYIY